MDQINKINKLVMMHDQSLLMIYTIPVSVTSLLFAFLQNQKLFPTFIATKNAHKISKKRPI